ncbi:hypothetical protein CEXT_581551 [Caerostris extrusa]|uniref:LAGLIDADG homing endonuclease n=1 Tax=Caerostris extrusa TaxID=172846 RepID=A0AAV4NAI3_CAEEX|nr:hypothetical protein CEXT_581551 [Caerostris extrusa]
MIPPINTPSGWIQDGNNRLLSPGVHVLSDSFGTEVGFLIRTRSERRLGFLSELLRKHSSACYDSADKYAEWMDAGWRTTAFYHPGSMSYKDSFRTEVEVLIGNCCVNTRVRNKLSIRREKMFGLLCEMSQNLCLLLIPNFINLPLGFDGKENSCAIICFKRRPY